MEIYVTINHSTVGPSVFVRREINFETRLNLARFNFEFYLPASDQHLDGHKNRLTLSKYLLYFEMVLFEFNR